MFLVKIDPGLGSSCLTTIKKFLRKSKIFQFSLLKLPIIVTQKSALGVKAK